MTGVPTLYFILTESGAIAYNPFLDPKTRVYDGINHIITHNAADNKFYSSPASTISTLPHSTIKSIAKWYNKTFLFLF